MVLVIGKYSDKSNAEPLVRPLSGKRVEGEVKVTNNLFRNGIRWNYITPQSVF